MTESSRFQFGPSESRAASLLIAMARAEDLGSAGDITSTALIPAWAVASADLVSREAGSVAGLPVLELLLREFGLFDHSTLLCADGDSIDSGTRIARIEGSLRSLLEFERIALNFLQRLCGIATLTARFVAAVSGTHATILDTRKTTPGWRSLEKYAVRCGGGRNHRLGLHDAVLIKDNHLAWLLAHATDREESSIERAIAAARDQCPDGTIIEVEVDDLEQFDQALKARPDIILVDNIGSAGIREAVRRRDMVASGVQLEASGGITLATVAEIARTGVDRISVGALTHSAPALDLGLDLRVSAERFSVEPAQNIAAHS